jgi:hypothetical protein
VGKNGKFGYVNRRGKEITPLKYDKAMRFYWDVGKVCINGKWGLVNKRGKEITPLIYDEIRGHQDPIVKLNGKYGYLNRKTGKLLTPIKYDKAEEWHQILDFLNDGFGHDDLAKVKLKGKWGCIDLHGNEIVPLKYSGIEINQTDKPYVAARLNGKWGFVGDHGTEITLFEYDSVRCFYERRARVEKNGKYGFIDDKGDVVIPTIYDDCETHFVKEFDGNRRIFPIWIKSDGKYGYVDINGKVIVPPVYEYATSLYDGKGLAAVVLNGKVGFIDETGKEVILFIYEPDFDKPYNYRFHGDFANVKFNGKWGVIDKNNRVVIPFLYDAFLENQNVGWRYALHDGKKWGIDAQGNEWRMRKDPDARTFKDYLHAVTWEEVAPCFSALSLLVYNDIPEYELAIYKENFNNFLNKQPKSSQDIIRIHHSYYTKNRNVDVTLYNVKRKCSYGYFDWGEILDMEVRIEDNLTLSDAEVVAVCLWGACDRLPMTEKEIKNFLNGLHEQVKTLDENHRLPL